MTIKEVEERTGLTRSNIRFYEKEKLIEPSRNDKNGYRDYSEKDVENIKKIAYLRTLEISIEDIRNIISDKVPLAEIIKKQTTTIQAQIEVLNQAKTMCERMLESGNISFDELQVEKYVGDLETYWSNNKPIFKLDSVSFLYIWGSLITWTIITALCLIIGILSYTKLPSEIPVQWDNGIATSVVDKKLCFIALSAEVFSIMFVYGLIKSVVAVLLVDTVALIGILIVGITKISLGHSPAFK